MPVFVKASIRKGRAVKAYIRKGLAKSQFPFAGHPRQASLQKAYKRYHRISAAHNKPFVHDTLKMNYPKGVPKGFAARQKRMNKLLLVAHRMRASLGIPGD